MDDRIAPLTRLAASAWRPGIGDPTVLGRTTVAAYIATAGLCAWAARREGRERRGLVRVRGARPGFWWCLAALLVALGINKQLDLQSLVTVLGRRMARQQGWYAQRRSVQVGFILGILAGGLAALAAAAYAVRRSWRRHGLALAGVMLLACFIAVRAASFHHVDAWLRWQMIEGIRLHVLLELGDDRRPGGGRGGTATARKDAAHPPWQPRMHWQRSHTDFMSLLVPLQDVRRSEG